MHKPVLRDVVLSYLNLKPGQVVLDATLGSGGHAEAILHAIGPQGFLIGLDQDEEAIKRAQACLEQLEGRFKLMQINFRFIDQALSSLNIHQVNAVLLDVGVSSEQLENPERGFGIQHTGPLDMRMDQRQTETAAHLIAKEGEYELAKIFREYGEERHANRIARTIVRERVKAPIETTEALKTLIERITPARFRYGRIHPATRVFQALRIAVNDELGALEESLPKAFDCLDFGGRLCVISFHSLEDRIVKRFFLKQKQAGVGTIVTKKPVRPSDEEVANNTRARSAKLRVIERN